MQVGVDGDQNVVDTLRKSAYVVSESAGPATFHQMEILPEEGRGSTNVIPYIIHTDLHRFTTALGEEKEFYFGWLRACFQPLQTAGPGWV